MMESNLFGEVRRACRRVAENANHVRINVERIPTYAKSLGQKYAASSQLDPSCHYLGRGMDTVAFLLTLDSINFGSGYFPHFRKRSAMSGYFTVAASLNDYFRERGPLSASRLAEVSEADCFRIFGQDDGNQPIRELMQLFANALNDLGRYLLDNFEGSFIRLVESAGQSAEQLVQLLIRMPYFNDVVRFQDFKVPFYKRAQLAAADLALAFEGEGAGRFDDLEKLTIFADNLVPHVLRMDGVLIYKEDLIARINEENLIPAGSREEIEIRACALHAVELLVEELRRSGQRATAMRLDYFLWNRGQQPHYKAHPRHRTRTVFY